MYMHYNFCHRSDSPFTVYYYYYYYYY